MKTEDILNLDCRIEKNVQTINKFLYKVKPVGRLLEKNLYTSVETAPLELLEQALHGINIHYGYSQQHIIPYYENNTFVFYNCSIIKKRETNIWIGNVYGKTLWETTAKTLIKIYADILKEKKQDARKE